jgi:hypothetical protein
MSESESPKKPQPPDGEETISNPDKFASGYDFLLVNSSMQGLLYPRVMRSVLGGRKNSKLVLCLITYGGSADVAYRIGRYLQSVYDEITVFIPSMCKSAGTLLATAAHSIVMTPFGELGPLDVQLRQRAEIFGRRSGLITRAAISDLKNHTFELFEHFMLEITGRGSISFKTAAEIAARTSAEIMGRIYEQINPDLLGQDFRDLNVATEYCERLNGKFENIQVDVHDPESNGIKRLVHGYPSHDFVIDFEEAKEIFQRVELPSDLLYAILQDERTGTIVPRDSGMLVEISQTSDYIGVEASEPPADAPPTHEGTQGNAPISDPAPSGRDEGREESPP